MPQTTSITPRIVLRYPRTLSRGLLAVLLYHALIYRAAAVRACTMAKERATVRQRSKAAPEQTVAEAKPVQDEAPLTTMQLVNYYTAQYIGLVCCVLGIALLWAGYGRDWMHNTHLCLLCLGLCLLGYFFHELRPFNVSSLPEVGSLFTKLLQPVLHSIMFGTSASPACILHQPLVACLDVKACCLDVMKWLFVAAFCAVQVSMALTNLLR